MGNSGSLPDVGVRLSAQGVQDVINAFARVRQEGKKTGTETAASLELINGALETMAELLPAISFAIVVDQLVDLGLNARESAENLGKLSEKTGAALGTLSALNLAAHDNEVSQESLSNGLVKLAKNQEDASNGSAKQLKAFKDLGITINDLKTQDPGQLFVTVAQKMAALPDGAQKANIAIALFGKAGAELIPMLKSLGVDGFDAAVTKAKKLGLYLSTDMVESARAAQDALHEIGDIANGVATQFVAGFVPQFTSGVEILAEGLMGDGVNSVQTFGDVAGRIFKALTLDLLVILDTAKFVFTSFTAGISNVAGQSKAFLQGMVAGGGVAGGVAGVVGYNQGAGANYSAEQDQRRQDYINSIKTIRSEANVEPTRTASKPSRSGVGASGDGTNAAQQEKTAQARAAYLQSLADNELAIEKTKNQLEESEDKRHYDAGLITVDQYYDKVEARIQDDAAAQTKALQAKLVGAESMPQATADQSYKRLQAIGQIQTQIAEVSLKETAQLAAAEDDRSKAKHDAAIAELSDQEKLQKLSGDKYGAEETALKIELEQYTELLQKQEKSTDEIAAAVSAYKTKAQATIDFGRNQESGSSVMSNLNIGIGNIQNQAANGSISNIDAQAQINKLQQDSLATLSQIGLQMTQNAEISGDQKAKDEAAAYNANIQKVAASLKNVTSASIELTNQLSNQGYNDLVNFFTESISGAKSFGDAMADLGTSFENIVSKMVSQLIVFEALESILGWLAPDSSALKNLNANGPFSSSPLTGKFKGGGYTGNVAVDQVAGVVHGQEWVFDADTTRKNRSLFEAIQNGQTPTIRSVSSAATTHSAAYADEVNSSGGVTGVSAAPQIQVINKTGQPTSQKQSKGPNGQSMTEIIIGVVAADVTGGGAVGKAMQTSYGVTRRGVNRG